MVVQHNLTAMNSNRMLGITQNLQAKSSEKLSSGYRINRAADDAAGLAISEKMRKQINGLDTASTNAQDGVSAVQTAEGALTEVHSMLQRMNELAVQAANGTNSESDREAIQAEIEQLTTEIDRVAETTKFNETYLLKGATNGADETKTVAAHDAGLVGKLTDNGDGTSTFALNEKLEAGDKVTIAGVEYKIGDIKSDDDYIEDTAAAAIQLQSGDSVTFGDETVTLVDKALPGDITIAAGDVYVDKDGIEWTVVADAATLGDDTTDIGDAKAAGKGNVEVSKVATTSPLAAGVVIKKNAALTAANVKEVELVSGLEANEFSSIETARTVNDVATEASATLAAGDVITKADGTTQTVTTETPDSFADVSAEIMELVADGTATVTIADADGTTNAKTYTVVEEADVDEKNDKLTREQIIDLIKEGNVVEIDPDGTGATVAKYSVYGVDETVEEGTITATEAYKMMAAELEKASSIGTDTAAKVVNNNDGTFDITQGSVAVKDALTFNLHVGADADMTNKITIDIETMTAANLGIKGLSVAGDTGAPATYAIDAIADAITKVSEQRSALGAIQNRLEHTIANLDNVVENTTSAESRIRDTDMAEEMVEYSKNNILAQAGQSMLAQANQATQGVLSLLG